MSISSFYQNKLKAILEEKKGRNPKFSLRSFAKFLGVDSGDLANAISGNRHLSIASACKITAKLQFDTPESFIFISSVLDAKKTELLATIHRMNEIEPEEIALDRYIMLSDLYYGAIMEITFVKGFKSDPVWIAEQLDIPRDVCEAAIERLLRLDLLRYENGMLKKSLGGTTSADKNITNNMLRQLQVQINEKGIQAIKSQPIERRSSTGMTMAIDPSKLGMARDMINSFTNELTALLESGQPTKVFQLSINLFPLQKFQEP